jgi:hypothetical protein
MCHPVPKHALDEAARRQRALRAELMQQGLLGLAIGTAGSVACGNLLAYTVALYVGCACLLFGIGSLMLLLDVGNLYVVARVDRRGQVWYDTCTAQSGPRRRTMIHH